MGGASGATIGYIIGNVPGAVAGGFAGNRLGAVRDAKGKSVAQVFSGMESSKKAEVRAPVDCFRGLTLDPSRVGFQGIGQYGVVIGAVSFCNLAFIHQNACR